MSFAYAGAGALDYAPCTYGASKVVFRGPRAAEGRPWLAAIGGTEVYGKFVTDPWPALVAEGAGTAVANLGAVNAGPDLYLGEPDVLAVARGAAFTVVQAMGAANLSNRLYSVHPRRNDRFLSASPWLRTLYRDVDFTDFHFTGHLLRTLHHISPGRFDVVAAELRDTWVARMTDLLRAVGDRAILLWMGEDPPPDNDLLRAGRDPVLVTASMLHALRPHAMGYVEVIVSDGARAEGLDGMAFAPMDRTAAEGVPGPKAHREVADAICGAIRQFGGSERAARHTVR